MGTNCSPFLVYLFLYSNEAEFIQKLFKDKQIIEAKAFNLTFMYIVDVLSINNPNFANCIPLMYPQRIWYKGNNRNSFVCLHSWHLPLIWHQWSTIQQILQQKRRLQFCNYKFSIYIFIRYPWVCSLYSDFLQRHSILSTKLLNCDF